ncbi:hypothetical protein J1N44_17920 [Acidovorax temperans]|uniref:hypothetical protein n=1 Tax=Acidovorax temperans TaxID=80878 RepID=UPI001A9424D6|nr:hypothetical protein [Acidovorax temperans]MBO0943535.1 hypothetical protein [Acidovorax temperans]
MTPLVRQLVPLTRNAERYHWFDIGEMSNDFTTIDGSDPIASRLAFPQCAFAYTEDGDPGVLLMTQHNETSIHVSGLASHRGQWFEVRPITIIYDAAAGYSGEGKGVTSEQLRVALVNVAYCARLLDQGASAFAIDAQRCHINTARAKKGKGPLKFTWHTVTIAPRPDPNEQKGGTHASPRLHDRRGHWRNYASGKKGWVKECKVGSPSKGIVFKDYKIKEKP